MNPEDLIERPDNLDSLTITELRELHARAVARRTELRAQDAITVAEATEVRRLTQLANEVHGLVTDAVSAAAEELTGAELPADPPAPAPVVEDETPAPADTPVVAPVAEIPAPVVEPEVQLPHAASVTLDDVLGTPPAVTPVAETPRRAFTAAAGLAGIDGGADLEFNEGGMGAVMAAVQNSTVAMIQGRRFDIPDDQRKVRIAAASFAAPGAERLSDRNGPVGNDRIIDATPYPEADHVARTAAICGPADIQREIDFCLGMGRPILGMFRQLASDRGSFQYTRSIGLGPVAAGVVIWTDADQAAVDESDPTTWKPCVQVTCPTYEEVCSTPIPSCLIADVFVNFSSRETIQDWVKAIGVQTERVAEGDLLRKIDLYSSNYTVVSTGEDAIPHLFDALSTFLGMAENVNRLGDIDGYVAIIPAGLRRRLGLSRFRRQFSGSEDSLEAVLTELGIRSVTTPDWTIASGNPWANTLPLNPVGRDACLNTTAVPAAPAIAMPQAPNHWRIRLIDPRAAFFFSPENFAFGMERDPQLMRQNKMQWFGELFEGLAKRGCAPWFTFDITLCPDGSRAGTITPITCGPNNPIVAMNAPTDSAANELLVVAAAAADAGLAGAAENLEAVGNAVAARKAGKS